MQNGSVTPLVHVFRLERLERAAVPTALAPSISITPMTR